MPRSGASQWSAPLMPVGWSLFRRDNPLVGAIRPNVDRLVDLLLHLRDESVYHRFVLVSGGGEHVAPLLIRDARHPLTDPAQIIRRQLRKQFSAQVLLIELDTI